MNIKNIFIPLVLSLAVIGCSGGATDGCGGWRSKDITSAGQVKKVNHVTPVFCPDHYVLDVSLGVMRNGVGSMSTQDMELFIPDNMVPELKKAAESSSIINFTYDERRFMNCIPFARVTSFKVVN